MTGPATMGAAEMLRPAEAAVVSGMPLREVHHAITREILPERLVARGRERRIAVAACLFLTFYHDSAGRLTAEERLFAIRAVSGRLRTGAEGDRTLSGDWTALAEDWVVRDAFLRIDLEPFVTSTAERWRRYRAAVAAVAASPGILGGLPVLAGTRIPVHDVAASVAAGHAAERIRAAYPGLTAEQVDQAVLFAQANPAQGRPRTGGSLGRLLAQGRLVSEERVPRRRKAG